MTSPGGRCGTCDCASSGSTGVAGGASSFFGADCGRACSARSLSMKAAEADHGDQHQQQPEAFFAFCSSAERRLSEGQMQVAVQGSYAALCAVYASERCKRTLRRPPALRGRRLCRPVLQRGLHAKDCHGWPMRARPVADFCASGAPEIVFVIGGSNHVATHRGFRERIRAAVIGHGSCAIAAGCSCTPPAPATPAAQPNDYSKPETWLCRPDSKDSCAVDLSTTIVAPSGKFKKESFKAARNAPIDCFYVYPTVSLDQTGNSDMTAGPEEHGVILQQFARFSSVCRVYAPLYRQVTLTALRSIIARQGDARRPHARVQRRRSTPGTTISRTTTPAAASCSSATRRARAC